MGSSSTRLAPDTSIAAIATMSHDLGVPAAGREPYLDCGACGGQTGEVNARVLADVLNAPTVRRELAALGSDVPTTTWFVSALHDTTTDTVELFDTELIPASHRERVVQLTARLREAGDRARAERAADLGLGHLVSQPRRQCRARRRPSIAHPPPRPPGPLLPARLRLASRPGPLGAHADHDGADGRHQLDQHAVPRLDRRQPPIRQRQQVLHNAVGGRISVFEGNGGDLRIGLPSPKSVDALISSQALVQDLVGNGRIHLLRIDPATGAVERCTPGGWQPAPE